VPPGLRTREISDNTWVILVTEHRTWVRRTWQGRVVVVVVVVVVVQGKGGGGRGGWKGCHGYSGMTVVVSDEGTDWLSSELTVSLLLDSTSMASPC